MESEPLVTTKYNRTMNYTSEDGSSILNPGEIEHDTLTSGNDKPSDSEKFNYATLERFHEDALQQVDEISPCITFKKRFSFPDYIICNVFVRIYPGWPWKDANHYFYCMRPGYGCRSRGNPSFDHVL